MEPAGYRREHEPALAVKLTGIHAAMEPLVISGSLAAT
jgi:hypothetical protein